MLNVVAIARHQVSATHIKPFQPREVFSETTFNGFEHLFEVVRVGFTKCVEMESNMFNGIQHPAIVYQRINGSLEILREFNFDDYKHRMD